MTYDNALLLTQQCKGQETVHMLQNVDVCANQHHQKNITHKKNIHKITGTFCVNGVCVHSQWSEFRSCVKVEVAVLGSPSLTVRTVSVDVKQH